MRVPKAHSDDNKNNNGNRNKVSNYENSKNKNNDDNNDHDNNHSNAAYHKQDNDEIKCINYDDNFDSVCS